MRRILFTLVFLFSPAAFALRIADSTAIIPIIGRFPGAGGTQWRTDVFIGNPYGPAVNVTLTFYVAGGSPMTTTVTVDQFSTMSLPDITLNTFGLTNASGQLALSTGTSSQIEARARIYNSGNPAGQFGQNVPGLGQIYLGRQAYIYGLSGINGNRVNIGVANPNNDALTVSLRITSKNNVTLAQQSIALQPHETHQINDIFATLGIAPQADVIVSFLSPTMETIYGYASEVRNDTGDAVFMYGTSPNS